MKIFGGQVSANGFEVYFWDVQRNKYFSARSSEHLDKQKRRIAVKKIFYLFCYFFPIPLILHCLLLWKDDVWCNIVSSFALFFFILTLSTVIVSLKQDYGAKTARQWHSCKHKLISLLKEILKDGSVEVLAIRNLDRAERAYSFCESLIHILFATAILAGYAMSLFIPVEYSMLLVIGVVKYLGIVKSFLLFLIFLFFSFILNYMVQLLFLTAEPSKEQLEETLRVGKEFLEKYNQISNNQKLL